MDYLLGFDLAGVIDKLALPLIKNELPEILRRKVGPDWYQSYAKGIMENYQDYHKLFEYDEEPLKGYDISALWFLLFPYKTEQGEFVRLDGAGSYFQEAKGLSDEQMAAIEALRTLRNGLVHGNVRMRFIQPDHQRYFELEEQTKVIDGTETMVKTVRYLGDDEAEGQRIIHEDALDYIENALSVLDPGVSVFVGEKRSQILAELMNNDKLVSGSMKKLAPHNQQHYAQYLNAIKVTRQQYRNVTHYEWQDAPVGLPLDPPLPWVKLGEELEEGPAGLPWKEVEEAAAPPAPPAPPQLEKPSVDTTVTMKDVTNTAKNIGKSLFGLFSKK